MIPCFGINGIEIQLQWLMWKAKNTLKLTYMER